MYLWQFVSIRVSLGCTDSFNGAPPIAKAIHSHETAGIFRQMVPRRLQWYKKKKKKDLPQHHVPLQPLKYSNNSIPREPLSLLTCVCVCVCMFWIGYNFIANVLCVLFSLRSSAGFPAGVFYQQTLCCPLDDNMVAPAAPEHTGVVIARVCARVHVEQQQDLKVVM